jgi:hypothetical protein
LGFAAVGGQLAGDVDFSDETIGARLGAKVGFDEIEPAPGGLQFAKLLGFAAVGGQLAGDVDFSDETLGAKLGAKVGTDEAEPAPSRHIEAADK